MADVAGVQPHIQTSDLEKLRSFKPIPLCIDLDGSLFRGDSLHELIIWNLKHRFTRLISSLWKLFKGKAAFKTYLATDAALKVETWPYRNEVIELIGKAKLQGRKVYLVSGAPQALADKVAQYFGVFDGCFASDPVRNLTGKAKAQFLVEKFGEKNFDYLGNENRDLEIWKFSQKALVVGAAKLAQRTKLINANVDFLEEPVNAVSLKKVYFHVFRIHQWVKNLLIFFPLIAAHRIFETKIWIPSILAFFSFSFLASTVYIINDLLDLESDRLHSHKRIRGFASGRVPITHAFFLVPLLMGLSSYFAFHLPPAFGMVLGIYFVTTNFYSFWFKRIVIWDVLILAGLYSLRILAGGSATGLEISEWLLAFSMFFFLSLAFMKRFSEVKDAHSSSTHGRGYQASDLQLIQVTGAVSGYLSVLVLALYINRDQVRLLYPHPQWLWLACPLLIYWLTRLWLIAHRGQIHSDTVVFAAKEKATYLVGLLLLVVILLASI